MVLSLIVAVLASINFVIFTRLAIADFRQFKKENKN